MPKRYAYNTSATQVKKRYAMIGSTATQVKKRYAMVGNTATLVYSAEEYLVQAGVINSGLAGSISAGTYASQYGTVSSNSGYVRLNISTSGTFPFYNSKAINLTNYKTCYIKFKTKGSSQAWQSSPYQAIRMGFSSSKITDCSHYNIITSNWNFSASYTGASTSAKTISFDISGLSGNYYLLFIVQSSGGGITNYLDIYDIYLA